MYETLYCDNCGRNIYLVLKLINAIKEKNKDKILNADQSMSTDIIPEVASIINETKLSSCCALSQFRINVCPEIYGFKSIPYEELEKYKK